jgi:hypothetical protein
MAQCYRLLQIVTDLLHFQSSNGADVTDVTDYFSFFIKIYYI